MKSKSQEPGFSLKSNLALKLLLGFPILFLAAFTPIPSHVFYVSIHEIKYDAEWGALNLQVKIFSDDLENALQDGSKDKLYLRANKESPHIDRYLYAYLNKHIQLKNGDKPIPLVFTKKKFVEDATWTNLKAYGLCEMKSLTVKSSVLLELFDEQTNIIRLKAYGKNWLGNLDRHIQEKKFSIK